MKTKDQTWYYCDDCGWAGYRVKYNLLGMMGCPKCDNPIIHSETGIRFEIDRWTGAAKKVEEAKRNTLDAELSGIDAEIGP